MNETHREPIARVPSWPRQAYEHINDVHVQQPSNIEGYVYVAEYERHWMTGTLRDKYADPNTRALVSTSMLQ